MAVKQVPGNLSEIVRQSAEIYKDIDTVTLLIKKHAMHDYPEMELISLASGYPGISLLLDKLDEVYPGEGWAALAFKYNQEIVRLIGNIPFHSLSLYTGLAGVIYLFNECSRGSTRYTNVLSQTLDMFLSSYGEFYEETRGKLEDSLIEDSDLDLISGWTGIAATLMEVKERQDRYVGKLDAVLLKILQLITDAVGKLRHFEELPEQTIYYNLGMAHGITGAINLLAVAHLRRYPLTGLREVLEVAKTFLHGSIREWNGTLVIPNMFTPDESAETSRNPGYHRDAWCYGTPGASVAMFRLGLALEDKALQQQALQLFNTVYSRPDSLRKVISPTICHGYAGLVLIQHHFSRAAAMPFKDEFLHRLLSYRNTGEGVPFIDLEGSVDDPLSLDKVGLLDGCAGVLLTLLTCDNENLSTWKQMLVFS
ncbi:MULTISPECIES: lanthionine synthetase C family protein [Paenibacillus]|uniref:Subtilin biosynthesis protein spaC n=1 Tax=Paenibacillus polymyxa TaxID=1406 RepID=A0A378XSB3_PAEPO|nr:MULTISPECIES: lanthionine synthetase C family protein [Paenibacillus]KAE8559541.1 hypothetical protein BJH92_13740 [Paenibacillus polymyxa]KAF6583071.1 lanthionine synthetase C family protein [Paenibacillus sp. EKM211P]KKD55274.1 hypothetical protein C400_05425 [Paenibacillus sp. ICGEB2008]MBE7897651.1 lanthionine synthetase C family protein [Paenibacillus polymyxa]MBG9764191.1 hypothetical protein [Paenibacillus polymyxa]